MDWEIKRVKSDLFLYRHLRSNKLDRELLHMVGSLNAMESVLYANGLPLPTKLPKTKITVRDRQFFNYSPDTTKPNFESYVIYI